MSDIRTLSLRPYSPYGKNKGRTVADRVEIVDNLLAEHDEKVIKKFIDDLGEELANYDFWWVETWSERGGRLGEDTRHKLLDDFAKEWLEKMKGEQT